MTSTDDVHHGISSYLDYDRPWASQRQWLVSDRGATIWSNVLAIFLTLATARAFPIVKRVLLVRLPQTPAAVVIPGIELGDNRPQAQNSDRSLLSSSLETPTTGQDVPGILAGAAGPSSTEENRPADREIPKSVHGENHKHSLRDQIQDEESVGRAGLHSIKRALQQLKPHAHDLPATRRSSFHLNTYLGDVRRHLRDNLGEIGLLLLIGLGLLTLNAIFVATSILSGLVVSDSVALSNSPHCRLMKFDTTNSTEESKARWSKHFHDIEVESAAYAKRCYPANARSEECSYFYNQSIHFSVKHNDTCPFLGGLCLDGSSGAFTMTTGMIRLKTIGINTRLNYQFERTTTCSPLRMDDGRFIQRHSENGRDGFHYLYGGFSGSTQRHPALLNLTWDLPIEILSRPSYRVFGTSKTPYEDDGGWQPISELEPANDTSVSIILVGNTAVSYPGPSEDPIFPAQKQLSDGLFYNQVAHSTVLGCNDRTTICAPDGTTCGSVEQLAFQVGADDEAQIVFAMLAHSLIYSITANSIRYRTADALDAQSNLVAGHSLILAKEQWKIEAQQLFATSLARIQITARDIARGVDANLPQNSDLMDRVPVYRGMCSIYKFKTVGWKNMNVAGVLWAFFGGALLIALSFELEDTEELWFEKPCATFVKLCWKYLRRAGLALRMAMTEVWRILKSLVTKSHPVQSGEASPSSEGIAPEE